MSDVNSLCLRAAVCGMCRLVSGGVGRDGSG